MSFFIRPGNSIKRNRQLAKQNKPNKKKKDEVKKVKPNEDEIDSDDEDLDDVQNKFDVNHLDIDESEETAQEKKLRLAKLYLEEIERKEKALKEKGEANEHYVSTVLKEDVKEKLHKLQKPIADSITGYDVSGIKMLRCKQHRFPLTCVVVSSDNKYLYSGSKDSAIVKWSLDRCQKDMFVKCYKTSSGKKKLFGSVLCLAISSDNKFLVSGGTTNEVLVWNPSNLEHIHTFTGHKGSITGLAFQRNHHTLFSTSSDRCVKVWNLVEMAYVESLFGHQSNITSVDGLFSERCLTGSEDVTVRIWKIVEESQLIYNAPGSVDCVKFVNDNFFVSCGADGSLCLWGALKKKPLCVVSNAHGIDPSNNQPNWLGSVTSLFNSDLVASGSGSGSIKLWKCDNNFRKLVNILDIDVVGFVNSMVFTSDGNYLIAAVGCEPRLGRWWKIGNAKNCVLVIPLLRNSNEDVS